MKSSVKEFCGICGCKLHRNGDYAKPTVKGRSHATKHHLVSERFFGRSVNRKGTQREPIFEICPWENEKITMVFCYECHELLLHNPVMLPEDIELFHLLVKRNGLSEMTKSKDYSKIAGRIKLLREVISLGLKTMCNREEK